MFTSILNSADLGAGEFAACTAASVLIGLAIAFSYMFRSSYSKNFVCTLVMLPVIVQALIMLVNGNVGTGVAVLGAFSLIRFRSVPGTSREIGALFLAMAAGIATGMGQIWFAAVFTGAVCVIMIVLTAVNFGGSHPGASVLKITVPEDLDYNGVFDDIFEKYTSKSVLMSSRTTNMGSLYELKYNIIMKNTDDIKSMTDELRCRNGNLTIVCSALQSSQEEL